MNTKKTTFQRCVAIQGVILKHAAEVYMAEGYGNTEHLDEALRTLPERIIGNKHNEYMPIDPTDLTLPEMDALGFGHWSDEVSFRLIPFWMHRFLSSKFKAQSINGDAPKIYKKAEIDADHRFGFLAYGVVPKEMQQ
jgi:hypothetical protein